MSRDANPATIYYPPPAYRTPEPVPRPWRIRLLPGAGARFYVCMLYSVLWAARRARHGAMDRAAWAWISARCARYAEWAGARLAIDGLEHLHGTSGPVVVVGNHMSTLETFLLPAIIDPVKPLAFVVKQTLLDHPLFGKVMRSVPYIAVSRTNPRADLQAVLEQGAAMLAAGRSLCIFPQATRSATFDENHFNSLGVKLARRAGATIIPVAMRTDFWGNGRWLKDLGPIRPALPVHIAFGPPVPAGLSAAAAQAQVVTFVRTHLQAWGVPCVPRRAEDAPAC